MPITMVAYKDKGIYRLKAIDDIMQALEDHQVQLSSMKATRYIKLVALVKLTSVLIILATFLQLSWPYIEFS